MANNIDEHPDPYIHLPAGKHTHTLIVLHGTSQTGPQFAAALLNFQFAYPYSISPSSKSANTPEHLSTLPAVQHNSYTLEQLLPTAKLIFPTGSQKPTTVFGGAITHAWFDIHDFGDRTKGEEDQLRGMRESARYLDRLVRAEQKILSDQVGESNEAEDEMEKGSKVALLGFSQGCAMGIMMVLSGLLDSGEEKSRRIPFIGLSGWLPFRAQIEAILHHPNPTYPNIRAYIRSLLQLSPLYPSSPSSSLEHKLHLSHGALDTKVKLEWALQMVETLTRMESVDEVGIELEAKVYDGLAHWFNGEEISGVLDFLGTVWGLKIRVEE